MGELQLIIWNQKSFHEVRGRLERIFDVYEDGVLFEMAVNEGLNNAVLHGFYDQGHPITVSVHDNEPVIKVIIEDKGNGFNFKRHFSNQIDPQEGLQHAAVTLKENGRGIWIMKEICDELEFNEQGNRVTLLKKLKKKGRV